MRISWIRVSDLFLLALGLEARMLLSEKVFLRRILPTDHSLNCHGYLSVPKIFSFCLKVIVFTFVPHKILISDLGHTLQKPRTLEQKLYRRYLLDRKE
jgi:ABC-type siderophore export system fused ATPase/permease subunit